MEVICFSECRSRKHDSSHELKLQTYFQQIKEVIVNLLNCSKTRSLPPNYVVNSSRVISKPIPFRITPS